MHTQAYRLFLNGKTVLEVALELGLSQEQAEKYYSEYLRMVHKHLLHSIFFEDEERLTSILQIHNALTQHAVDRTQYATLIAKLHYIEPPQWQLRALEKQVSELKSRLPHLESSISTAEIKVKNLDIQIYEKEATLLDLSRRIEELRQKKKRFKQLTENAIKGDIESLCNGVLDERCSFRREKLEAFFEDIIPMILDTLQYDPGMTMRLANFAREPEDEHWFSERLRNEASLSIDDWIQDPSKWKSGESLDI